MNIETFSLKDSDENFKRDFRKRVPGNNFCKVSVKPQNVQLLRIFLG